jgi:MscS family membrane protein
MTGITDYLKISASPYINGLVSFLVFVAVAKIADVLVNRVFRKFAKFTKSDVDDRIIDVIHRPVYLTIVMIGCTFAVAYVKGSPGVVFYTDGIVYSVISVVWAITAIKVINILIEHVIYGASDETGLRKDIVPLTENIFKVIVIGAVLLIILSIWKISITPLLASAGIVGVAVAIAAKDMLSNFFGGISSCHRCEEHANQDKRRYIDYYSQFTNRQFEDNKRECTDAELQGKGTRVGRIWKRHRPRRKDTA